MGVPRRPKTPDFGANPTTSENKYNVSLHVYPPDLAWTQKHQNYVAFYINVPEDSVAAGVETFGDVEPLPGAINTSEQSVDIPLAGKITLTASKNYKRLQTAIVLPIMEQQSVRYSADWDAATLGPVVGYMLTNGVAGNNGQFDKAFSMEGLKNGDFRDMALDGIKALSLAMLPDALVGGNASRGDLFSAIRRAAFNDHRTQLFRNMRFRDFSFEYRMSPKNKEEANTIKNIIQTFKYHMHPDSASGNAFLTYPSEFDIVFYFKDKENTSDTPEDQNLFKISTCALVDFQVNYGGRMFYTFDDGMPTEIEMRLNFMELEIMTKDRIKQGF